MESVPASVFWICGDLFLLLFSLYSLFTCFLYSLVFCPCMLSLTPHIWHSILRVNITVAWLWWLDEAVCSMLRFWFFLCCTTLHMIGSCMGCLSNVFLCQSLYNMITFFLFSRRENTIISTTK